MEQRTRGGRYQALVHLWSAWSTVGGVHCWSASSGTKPCNSRLQELRQDGCSVTASYRSVRPSAVLHRRRGRGKRAEPRFARTAGQGDSVPPASQPEPRTHGARSQPDANDLDQSCSTGSQLAAELEELQIEFLRHPTPPPVHHHETRLDKPEASSSPNSNAITERVQESRPSSTMVTAPPTPPAPSSRTSAQSPFESQASVDSQTYSTAPNDNNSHSEPLPEQLQVPPQQPKPPQQQAQLPPVGRQQPLMSERPPSRPAHHRYNVPQPQPAQQLQNRQHSPPHIHEFGRASPPQGPSQPEWSPRHLGEGVGDPNPVHYAPQSVSQPGGAYNGQVRAMHPPTQSWMQATSPQPNWPGQHTPTHNEPPPFHTGHWDNGPHHRDWALPPTQPDAGGGWHANQAQHQVVGQGGYYPMQFPPPQHHSMSYGNPPLPAHPQYYHTSPMHGDQHMPARGPPPPAMRQTPPATQLNADLEQGALSMAPGDQGVAHGHGEHRAPPAAHGSFHPQRQQHSTQPQQRPVHQQHQHQHLQNQHHSQHQQEQSWGQDMLPPQAPPTGAQGPQQQRPVSETRGGGSQNLAEGQLAKGIQQQHLLVRGGGKPEGGREREAYDVEQRTHEAGVDYDDSESGEEEEEDTELYYDNSGTATPHSGYGREEHDDSLEAGVGRATGVAGPVDWYAHRPPPAEAPAPRGVAPGAVHGAGRHHPYSPAAPPAAPPTAYQSSSGYSNGEWVPPPPPPRSTLVASPPITGLTGVPVQGSVKPLTSPAPPVAGGVLGALARPAAGYEDVTDVGDEVEERFVAMFSYGSNNQEQMRGRVQNPVLRGRPAYVGGWARAFAAKANGWGGGSVATVLQREGARVYGALYLLTPRELEIIDVHEGVAHGVYVKKVVLATVRLPSGLEVQAPALTYVLVKDTHHFHNPTPQYLCACWRTVHQNFPELHGSPMEILDAQGRKRGDWSHPGFTSLPLQAFLVEVGVRDHPPWHFPASIPRVTQRLHKAGITTAHELYSATVGGSLNERMLSAGGGLEPFSDRALATIRRLWELPMGSSSTDTTS